MNRRAVKKIFKPPAKFWPIKFILLSVGLMAYFLLRLLRPLIRISVGCLHFDRIGHLSLNTELYLRCLASDKSRLKQYQVFVSGKPANRQLLRMIKRRVPVVENRAMLWICESLRSLFGYSDILLDLGRFSRPENFTYELDNIKPQLFFVVQEEKRGEQLLRKMGIGSGASFVCFHARDDVYLKEMRQGYSNRNWAYHDYRDCSVDNYLLAAEHLASLGIFTIRMGHIVKKELDSDNPYIIDYATRYRSDFGDIYLSAKCKFFIASDGGLSSIPWIFSVPVAYSNGAPPGGIAAWRKPDVFIPKKLWSKQKKRFLTFWEIISLGADQWQSAKQYEQAQIEVVENTPQEILGLVKEMNGRLDKTWVADVEDQKLQERYRRVFPKGHICLNFSSRIGAEFLRQNRDLLESEYAKSR